MRYSGVALYYGVQLKIFFFCHAKGIQLADTFYEPTLVISKKQVIELFQKVNDLFIYGFDQKNWPVFSNSIFSTL